MTPAFLRTASQYLSILVPLVVSAWQAGFTQTPVVTTRTPARQAVAAPAAGPIGLLFSGSIDAATAGNLRLFGSRRGGTVSGGGTASLSFQPTLAFAPGEQLSVTVPATLLGTNGVAARPEVYQFTATAGVGTVTTTGGTATSASSFTVTGPPSPVVLSRSPARHALAAAPGAAVALTFSEPMAAASTPWGRRHPHAPGAAGPALSAGRGGAGERPAQPAQQQRGRRPARNLPVHDGQRAGTSH